MAVTYGDSSTTSQAEVLLERIYAFYWEMGPFTGTFTSWQSMPSGALDHCVHSTMSVFSRRTMHVSHLVTNGYTGFFEIPLLIKLGYFVKQNSIHLYTAVLIEMKCAQGCEGKQRPLLSRK